MATEMADDMVSVYAADDITPIRYVYGESLCCREMR